MVVTFCVEEGAWTQSTIDASHLPLVQSPPFVQSDLVYTESPQKIHKEELVARAGMNHEHKAEPNIPCSDVVYDSPFSTNPQNLADGLLNIARWATDLFEVVRGIGGLH